MRRSVADLLVIADDLSGAAESAAAIVAATGIAGVPVCLLQEGEESLNRGSSRPVVIDTNSRNIPVEQLGTRLAPIAPLISGDPVVVAKIDSMLRGHVVAEIEWLRRTGRTVIVASALPSAGRIVRDGDVIADGTPLAQTTTWLIEGPDGPPALLKSFSEDIVTSIGKDVVRGAAHVLAARLQAASGVVVCDAETDEDLRRIALAALNDGSGSPIMVGSAALVAAVAGTLEHGAGGSLPDPPRRPRMAFVVGSAEPSAAAQVVALEAAGSVTLRLNANEFIAAPETLRHRAITEALSHALSVVTFDGGAPIERALGAELVAALAESVAAAADVDETAFVLTGGQTARAVLDAWGARVFTVHRTVDGGAAWGVTDAGTTVVTRPGSFGGDDGLVRILHEIGHTPANRRGETHMTALEPGPVVTSNDLPVIATTMGDGAGVGPEITVAALLAPVVLERSRPIVIGDAKRLQKAAAVLGLAAEIVPIERVSDAEFTPGRINVIDLALLPDDLPWGELSAVAGDAAFHYVRVAGELAMAGEVDAICTAPLNKEALHAAGHLYPGHTELLASLTGTEEVSMLLSTPRIKVIHVTTHIGLIDAIARIEPGLVERTIRRGISAMQGSGIPQPRVGVCAINPHAGEGGLFGYGEEEEKIAPAIRALQAEGLDVHGPLPADTAFFLGGRGDYDLIVAMYHDQGHGPIKVLGIEAGTNITVGLPVIRTSVDHGTAFDIAGKGIVDVRSMIEALRQAAEMSTARTSAAR